MPAIYQSYEFEIGDSLETKRKKLYLGVISAGEQAYTLGAAVAELRKKIDEFDLVILKLRNQFQDFKKEDNVQNK